MRIAKAFASEAEKARTKTRVVQFCVTDGSLQYIFVVPKRPYGDFSAS
jgi:hypothetical protein